MELGILSSVASRTARLQPTLRATVTEVLPELERLLDRNTNPHLEEDVDDTTETIEEHKTEERGGKDGRLVLRWAKSLD